MIFSSQKWNKGQELKAVMKVNSAISFEMMEAPLRNAWRAFLLPLLGSEMAGVVLEIYLYGPDPNKLSVNTEGSTVQEQLDAQLLEICQRANANLAFFADFDEISVRITDAGFQRQKSENESFQQAYKYQEDNLRASFRNKGFNALDEMLEFLFAHVEHYPEFLTSPAYTGQQSYIVRTTADVDEIYSINRSRIVFLRLKPHLLFVEQQLLDPALGEKLYNHLVTELQKPESDRLQAAEIERLRKACARYVVAMAVRRLMMETGSLTDRGLYFSSFESGEKGNEIKRPQTDERLAMQIANMKIDADIYMSSIQRIIQACFQELSSGNPQEVFQRDNDDKKTFWV